MQADAAAIGKNVIADGHLLVLHTLICEIPTVEAVRRVLILGSISTV
jgi:hypothetical protein